MAPEDQIILSQIPLADIIAGLREVVKQEIINNPILDNTIPEKLISEKELCDYLDITQPTILDKRKRGVVPYIQVGSAIRYDLKKVLAALEKNNSSKKIRPA